MAGRAAAVAAVIAVGVYLVASVRSQRAEIEHLDAALTELRGSARAAGAGPSSEPAAVRLERLRQRGRAAVEQRFQSEGRDQAWSAETEQQIDHALAAVPGVTLVSRACRTTLCQVVVRHDDASTQKNLARFITKVPPFDNEVSYQYDLAAAPPSTTMYLSRAGQKLPRVSD